MRSVYQGRVETPYAGHPYYHCIASVRDASSIALTAGSPQAAYDAMKATCMERLEASALGQRPERRTPLARTSSIRIA